MGAELGQLTALTSLSIRENQITALPGNLHCPGVHHYSMSCAGTMGRLQALVTCDCSYNHMEHLPAELGECRQLSSLDLQHNKLLDLPPEIGNLTQLTRLGLRYNQLHTGNIPATLANCVNLEEFNIENNCVSDLPEGLLSSLDKQEGHLNICAGMVL